jgi:hypothetical protein
MGSHLPPMGDQGNRCRVLLGKSEIGKPRHNGVKLP